MVPIRRFMFPVLLLLILFALLALGAREISFTSDEPAHIATGYALIACGKDAFWMLSLHGHPPLLNVLEAILLYLEKPFIPLEQLDGWPSDHIRYVRAFVDHFPSPERMEVVARASILLLTVVLGALVFRWGKDLWGYSTGLLVLFVLCFDPLLLAHGRLATTDAGTVALGTASLYVFWRWLRSPSWKGAIGWGILIGLTMLAKGSGILYASTVLLLCLWKSIRSQRALWLIQGITGGLIGLFILWAGYAFTWGPVKGIPIALPAPEHWSGLIAQAQSSQERWVFALGLRKTGNWWWYFPLAFLIKNPLPLILALAISSISLFRSPFPPLPLPLGLFALLYTLTCLIGGINIGYRHFLPVHPLIYFVIGRGLTLWLSSHRPIWRRVVGVMMGLWYIFGTVMIFPYEIAFFNELTGGPQNGYHYLIDSNLDWGQGYKALRRYLLEQDEVSPRLVYQYTYIPPEYYGIHAESFPAEKGIPSFITPFHPAPGRYIISITTLQRGWPGNDVYFWFRQTQPAAIVGFSFLVYDVSSPSPQWIAQCSLPSLPLSDSVIEYGFGQHNLRRVDFDCMSGWIYPFGGTQPGVYGFHSDLLQVRRQTFPSLLPAPPEPRDPFIVRRLIRARLSVDMNRYTPDHPAFVLYEQENAPNMPALRSAVVFPADAIPTYNKVTSVPAPITLKGPLTFLGAAAFRDESGLDVETWWQVTEGPITRPLSIMGHLLNGAGEMLGQDDGLGVSPVAWLSGDIIVRRHWFPLPPAGEELWLRTGVYWLDTMERWPVAGIPWADLLLIPLKNLPKED